MNKDLAKPEGLCSKGEAAYKAVVSCLRRRRMTKTGGCRAFFSPEEWRKKGERYCLNAVLIVVHDGGDLAPAFNGDYEDFRSVNAMAQDLEKAGFYAESATCWYTGIYPR